MEEYRIEVYEYLTFLDEEKRELALAIEEANSLDEVKDIFSATWGSTSVQRPKRPR